MVPNLDGFVFLRNLQLDKFEGANFKYDNSFFQILARKYPNDAFFCPKCKYFLILHEVSGIEKFEATD